MNPVCNAATKLLHDFEESGLNPVTINMGSCADFADALARDCATLGLPVTMTGTDYYWAQDGGIDEEALSRRQGVVLPPSLTWDDLAALDFANSASHIWIEHDGRCFDAEMLEGVDTPFEFPCIRHALTEIMDVEPGRLSTLVSQYEWWRQSLDIRLKREPFMESATTHKL